MKKIRRPKSKKWRRRRAWKYAGRMRKLTGSNHIVFLYTSRGRVDYEIGTGVKTRDIYGKDFSWNSARFQIEDYPILNRSTDLEKHYSFEYIDL